MSKAEIKKIREKLFKGLALARKKAIADAITHGTKLVTCKNGKPVLLDPKKIIS